MSRCAFMACSRASRSSFIRAFSSERRGSTQAGTSLVQFSSPKCSQAARRDRNTSSQKKQRHVFFSCRRSCRRLQRPAPARPAPRCPAGLSTTRSSWWSISSSRSARIPPAYWCAPARRPRRKAAPTAQAQPDVRVLPPLASSTSDRRQQLLGALLQVELAQAGGDAGLGRARVGERRRRRGPRRRKVAVALAAVPALAGGRCCAGRPPPCAFEPFCRGRTSEGRCGVRASSAWAGPPGRSCRTIRSWRTSLLTYCGVSLRRRAYSFWVISAAISLRAPIGRIPRPR
jgi:hypothetical protein